MMFKLMFLGLLACTSGQWVNPDEYEKLKTSMQTPLSYSANRPSPPVQSSSTPINLSYQTPPQIIVQGLPRRPAPTPPSQIIVHDFATKTRIPQQYSSSAAAAAPQQYSGGVQQAAPQQYFGSVQQAAPQQQPIGAPAAAVSAPDNSVLQEWDDHVNDIIVKGLIKFSLDVDREISRTQGTSSTVPPSNVVFSPISVAVALSLVLAGSAGRTFDEVARVLGLESGIDISRNSEIVHQMFGIMLAQLHSNLANVAGPRLDFATAAFVQDQYPILPQFKTISQKVYGNEVINVDFARRGRAIQQLINMWVKQKTRGKIDSILNDAPSPDTTLILLSALYFNGEWNQHFLQGATKRKPFFVEPNSPITVDMMYNGGQFPFYEDRQLGAKIIGLPYKGHQTSMYVVLPNEPGAKALRGFLNRLSLTNIESLIRNMRNETCIIALPKMKLSSTLSLSGTLANLGLTSLFDPTTADLSLISQPVNGGRQPSVNTTIESRFMQGSNDPQDGGPTVTIPPHMLRSNHFAYTDKKWGYTVEQWPTGFSIKKQRQSRSSEVRKARKTEESKDSYKVEGSEAGEAKVVNLEANKYRFQARQRTRRQSRPLNQDFLNYIKDRNFPSYGVDELRNSANLVNPHIFASDVLHKVEIEITEIGTEAAAATGVILERDGSQKRLVANRPFFFFIRHDVTGLILFWGTVNSPTPSY
ncbi:serine protease inhibitor 28Dc [Halictus rubicundus]|uniref:serine protease inhibitor 28Dc n=1 Tax=Halictus rubicundus TaxID=77578 RepID=UPI0040360DB0